MPLSDALSRYSAGSQVGSARSSAKYGRIAEQASPGEAAAAVDACTDEMNARTTGVSRTYSSDMREHQVKRPRDLAELERLDEEPCVADLPAAAAAHEATELLLGRSAVPRRLLLEGAEGSEVTVGGDLLLHGGGAEGANQLVLQVCIAHVKAQALHVGVSEAEAEAGPLESAPELTLLRGITEPRQSHVEPPRAVPIQEASDRLRTSHRHNDNPLGLEVPTAALGERFDRDSVAGALNEDHRASVGAIRILG